MHTTAVLQNTLQPSLSSIHARRMQSLMSAVDAVVRGSPVAITQMGRSLGTGIRIKHQIKRVDRLVGNRLLTGERDGIYRAMACSLLAGVTQPLILVDWSDFSVDQQQQLLRASLAVGGRAVTLYEELHPRSRLGNRAIQNGFMDHLKSLLPSDCVPVIVADAGFRTPFFRHVEQLGWHWLGRIRNQDAVCWEGAPYEWIGAKSLYPMATLQAQDLGPAQWAKKNPLAARLVLVRGRRHQRKDYTLNGRPRRSSRSRKQARRQREPWLLVTSPSLQHLSAKKIACWYHTRMQIEQGFRDTKSVSYGLGIVRGRHTSVQRATNLLLIAALATFALWLIGRLAQARGWDHAVRVNSSSRQPSYSLIYLARLIVAHCPHRLPRDGLDDPAAAVADYLSSLDDPT